jgi:arylsulfatase
LHPDKAVKDEFRLNADTLATHLSPSCATGAFHSNPYVSRAYGFDEDFNKFDDDLLLGRHPVLALAQRALNKFVFKRGAYHARAEEINERSLSWLDSLNDEPFFLWNHYMDVHGPYNPPKKYSKWANQTVSNSGAQRLYDKCVDDPGSLTADKKQLIIDLYDGEIRYTDAMIGELLSALREQGLLADSLIILTADHGDLLGEKGLFAHPRLLYDELIHVPLAVHEPGGDPTVSDVPVSTVDIVPTILSAVGESTDNFPGRSLLNTPSPEQKPRIIYSSAIGEDEDSNLQRFSARTTVWRYDLARDVTSSEIVDESVVRLSDGKSFDYSEVPANERDAVEDLRSKVEAHSEQHLRGNALDNTEEAANREIERRLEALGYK